jgi:hypothetical protein
MGDNKNRNGDELSEVRMAHDFQLGGIFFECSAFHFQSGHPLLAPSQRGLE